MDDTARTSQRFKRARPAAVGPGDKVAIVAPAGRVEREALELGIASLQAKGLRVALGAHVLDDYGHMAGTDRDRASDLMEAFLDPENLVESSLGTPYAPQLRGGILALEDSHEPPWRVDRMLTHLDHAGLLEAAAGFLIGSLSQQEDADTTGQELSVEQSLRDHLGRTRKPVLFGFPFGHIAAPLTLPLNCRVRLDATLRAVTVLEPAVNPAPS